MRATITVSGKQGAGKSHWLGQLKRLLLTTQPREAVEVSAYEADLARQTYQFDEFTIPAAPRASSSPSPAAGTTDEGGDRETWSIQPREDGYFYVQRGSGNYVAGFIDEGDAKLFLKLQTAPVGRFKAAKAALLGDSFRFDGDDPLFTGGRWPSERGWPSPRVLSQGPLRILEPDEKLSAAEAPAIHDCYGVRSRRWPKEWGRVPRFEGPEEIG